MSNCYFSAPSIMVKVTYNLKTVAYRAFSWNVLSILFISADMSVSWHYGITLRCLRVHTHTCLHKQLLQKYKAQRYTVTHTVKIPYLSRMINRKIHSDLCVCLFSRVVRSNVPPPKVWKFQHFNTIFSLIIEMISLLSCIYVPGHK